MVDGRRAEDMINSSKKIQLFLYFDKKSINLVSDIVNNKR